MLKASFLRDNPLHALAIQHNLSITQGLGAKVENLIAVGGPTRNKLWCHIIADVTGLRVQVMQERGGAALGDAILAAMGVGLIESADAMQRAHAAAGECYLPHAENHQRYQEVFNIYKDLYPRLGDLFPRLAKLAQNEERPGR